MAWSNDWNSCFHQINMQAAYTGELLCSNQSELESAYKLKIDVGRLQFFPRER